jgi:DNA 3'-phosphatase
MEIKDKKILFCDLDGTLIKTASGKTFPEDLTDFRIRKDVLDKIKCILEKNKMELISIVTNQGGVPKYISHHEVFVKLYSISGFIYYYLNEGVTIIPKFCESIDEHDPRRKPNTGMLSESIDKYYYKLKKVSEGDSDEFPNKNSMLMIGDASGKPGQFSDSDKKTAENFGIDYLDVEDFLKLNIE